MLASGEVLWVVGVSYVGWVAGLVVIAGGGLLLDCGAVVVDDLWGRWCGCWLCCGLDWRPNANWH